MKNKKSLIIIQKYLDEEPTKENIFYLKLIFGYS